MEASDKKNDDRAVVSLLQQGADANSHDATRQSRSLWQFFLDMLHGRPHQSANAVTAVQLAIPEQGAGSEPFRDAIARYGRVESNPVRRQYLVKKMTIIEALVSRGADPNAVNADGDTLLYMVEDCCVEQPFCRGTLKFLIQKGAQVDKKTEEASWTPLMCAVEDGDLEGVKTLLAFGANPNFEDWDGDTPVSRAASLREQGVLVNRYTTIIKLLKQAGAKK